MNIVSWNICDACNYDCSYCVQGKNHRGFPERSVVEKITLFLCSLNAGAGDTGWEVKISGGEPFFYPGLCDTAQCLAEHGTGVSVVTNFSFKKNLYARFIHVTGKRLRTFSVSLHREKVRIHSFIGKCLWLKKKLHHLKTASLVVNSVVTHQNPEGLLSVSEKLSAHNIRFYPQLLRQKGRPVQYNETEYRIIAALSARYGSSRGMNRGNSFKGKTCYAGMRYFIISSNGDCHTCYPGKRSGDGYLGNIVKGDVRLRDKPFPCPYDICPCTVPFNRGIIIE